MYVEVRHPFGTSFESEPLEVSPPVGSYHGNWNHNEFRDLVERYYRRVFGPEGKGIGIAGGTDIRMHDNTFNISMTAEFDIPV